MVRRRATWTAYATLVSAFVLVHATAAPAQAVQPPSSPGAVLPGLLSIDVTVDGNGDVWVMNPDGTDARPLTDTPTGFFSLRGHYDGTGSLMTFYSDRTGNEEIWLMDSDGENERQVTDDPGRDYNSSLSPDGSQIVWVSHRSDVANGDIWIADADGANPQQLVPDDDDGARDRTPFFSPDGSVVGFHSNRGGQPEIWTIRPDGTDLRQVTQSPPGTESYNIAWSPDGEQIAFITNRDGQTEAYVSNADGSDPRNVSRSPEPETIVTWAADGASLLVNRSVGGVGEQDGTRTVFRLPLDGGPAVSIRPDAVPAGSRVGIRQQQSVPVDPTPTQEPTETADPTDSASATHSESGPATTSGRRIPTAVPAGGGTSTGDLVRHDLMVVMAAVALGVASTATVGLVHRRRRQH